MDREKRKDIFAETVKLCERGYYLNESDEQVSLLYDGKIEPYTEFFKKPIVFDKSKLDEYDCKVEVVNEDCLYAAEKLYHSDKDAFVGVLNMASFAKPGGGVLNGSAAQEENLFRRTNLFKGLYSLDKRMSEAFNIKFKAQAYPLEMNYGGACCEGVTVFRGGEDVEYKLMEKPFEIDVITVAALKHPDINSKNYETITKNKIRTILNIGIRSGDDHLVLGAFGCGAYGNPPKKMAEMFKEVLSEDLYRHAFKKIVFAILDDHNAKKEHNPEGNYAPFAEVFKNGLN